MDSIRQDIDAAQQKLISANHKIGGLGRDLEIYKESHQNQLDAFCRLQDLILGKGSTAETYDDLLAPVQELINTNLQQAKEIEALKKGIERLKQKPENLPFSNIVQVFKDLKKEHQDLKDHVQFEKDNTLRAIREVLGAKNKTNDHPHETARNAAERVMRELQELKENFRELKSFILRKDPLNGLPGIPKNSVIEFAGPVGVRRTYTPPAGHVLVEQERYDELIRKEYNGENTIVHRDFYAKLVKDSEDLADIKAKLGIDT